MKAFPIVTLSACILLIALGPMVPFIHQNMMAWLIGLCVFIAALGLMQKSKSDTIFAALLAIAFRISWSIFTEIDERTLAIRTTSVLAIVILNIILLIGPWSRFIPGLKRLNAYRKRLGIAAFLLGMGHFSLLFGPYFQYSFSNAFTALFTFFGFTTLFILLFMSLSSLEWVKKYASLHQWRIINIVSLTLYFLFVGYAIWANEIQGVAIDPFVYVIFTSFILFWIFIAPWGVAPKIVKHVSGWKHFHMLVYVAYISLVIHAWMAAKVYMPAWLEAVYWLTAAVVIVSRGADYYLKKTLENSRRN